jgi:hypothetical protein
MIFNYYMQRDLNIKVFFLLPRFYLCILSIFSLSRMIDFLMLLYGIFGMALIDLFIYFVDNWNFICLGLHAFCRNHGGFDELITFFWIIIAVFLVIIGIDSFWSIFVFIILYADLTFFSAEQKNSYLQFDYFNLIFLKATFTSFL